MIRNRKFAGKPKRTGQALEWLAIGLPETSFVLSGPNEFLITNTSYVQHSTPELRGRRNEVQCQRIHGFKNDARCGIGQDGLALQAGRRYEMRMVAKTDISPMPVRIQLLSNDKSTIYFEAAIAINADEWQRHSFTFASPETDVNAHIEITFVGIGSLAIGAVSLLPEDNFLGMQRDVIELLREIGAPLLRWPGGNFAGDYRWADGLLEVDQRAPLQAFTENESEPHTHGYDFHEIGTDEFMALCRELGSIPFLSINIGWEGQEDAAAWVEYCNGGIDTRWGALRAERGHPEPYGVKYWSLGNEVGYGHMEGPNDAESYIEKALACANAMREIDPSIELVASGVWWYDEWITKSLPALAPVVQHFSFHEYHKPLEYYAGPAMNEDYRRVVIHQPRQALKNLVQVREKIDANVPNGNLISIAFDEWNLWYTWNRVPGVDEGIYTASMLDTFCKQAPEVGMGLGCYFEPVNEGAIMVSPTGSYLTASGQAFLLFKEHHGNELVEVVPESSECEVALTVSLNGDQLIATVVNQSSNLDYRVELKISGARQLTADLVRVLTGENCLPGSNFHELETLDIDIDGDTLALTLPRFGIAVLKLHMDK